MPDIGELSKRSILVGVFYSIMTYGIPIWIDALEIKMNYCRLEKRSLLLNIQDDLRCLDQARKI